MAPSLLWKLCFEASFEKVVAVLVSLGEKAVESDDLGRCAAFVGGEKLRLRNLSKATLVKIATAATKSKSIAEGLLDSVSTAAAASLKDWSMDDVATLLLAAAKAKCSASGAGRDALFGTAAQVLVPQVPTMSATQLIKIVLAIAKIASARPLLEALATEAISRMHELPVAQQLLLAQGLLHLGAQSAVLAKVLDCWVNCFQETSAGVPGEKKQQYTADHMAKFMQLLAPALLQHRIHEVLGQRLSEVAKALTPAGRACLEAAFPDGAGPDFKGKVAMLRAIASRRSRSRSRGRNSSRSPSRGRDRDRDREKEKEKERELYRDRDRRKRSRSSSGGRRRDRDRDRDSGRRSRSDTRRHRYSSSRSRSGERRGKRR
eukprot:gnl/TRDRNA2_/TRDRNA2_171794_c3_seq1.p1 gnl/TRDRNA2_/TRDRNA2_171794_c3~~gnl/TRDRNA2_/TRDRNA2_171794_c3_seq1.p1  ORF type:complete len:375 (+),score=58.73 gnl/TRDRNA2_/TRDRNA2_171794_c3_seq1:1-1125(+)